MPEGPLSAAAERPRLVQVDTFTDRLFGGNPAAVCILPRPRSRAWMQALAAEMNLSETAFLVGRPDGYDLRWFTPTVEVDLCGHATLASAHVLWEAGHLRPEETARFHTRSGLLSARRAGGLIELDFPADPDQPVDDPAIGRALGVTVQYLGRGKADYIALVGSQEELRALAPDFRSLAACTRRGVIVTCAGRPGAYDFASRFFAPAVGIDEDPVTGSAHCCLAPFWNRRTGRTEFVARQMSRRGGILRVRLAGPRVLIAGQAVTVFEARLRE